MIVLAQGGYGRTLAKSFASWLPALMVVCPSVPIYSSCMRPLELPSQLQSRESAPGPRDTVEIRAATTPRKPEKVVCGDGA